MVIGITWKRIYTVKKPYNDLLVQEMPPNVIIELTRPFHDENLGDAVHFSKIV